MVSTVPGQVIKSNMRLAVNNLTEAAELTYVRRPSVENINAAKAKIAEVIKELQETNNWLESFKNKK